MHIYYYTPLALNIANKQQATTSMSPFSFPPCPLPSPRRDSTLGILEPRSYPCQIHLLSHTLTSGGPGRWRQVGKCPPKSALFWAKNSHFSPETAPEPGRNAQTKGNGGYITPAS